MGLGRSRLDKHAAAAPTGTGLFAVLGQAVGALALAGLRQRHPKDTRDQRRRLADLLLGPERALRETKGFPVG